MEFSKIKLYHTCVASVEQSPGVVWIGLNDRESEGNFEWIDGSQVMNLQ